MDQGTIRKFIPPEMKTNTSLLNRADLALLLVIRPHGSLAATAAAAGIVPSVVTKRLAVLQTRLGFATFHRTTRRVTPTAQGETLCERAGPLLEAFHTLEQELLERQTEPSGLIRLACTFGFGR